MTAHEPRTFQEATPLRLCRSDFVVALSEPNYLSACWNYSTSGLNSQLQDEVDNLNIGALMNECINRTDIRRNAFAQESAVRHLRLL